MGDAYWRYNDARQQQQQPAVDLPSYLAKRPRPEYEVPSGQDMSSYYARDDGRGGLRVMGGSESINASYDRYLRTTQSSSYGGESGHSIGGQQFGDRRVVSIGGSDPTVTARSRSAGVPSRPEIQLPSDASNTLYVECLPANCTRREVSHIFRPFLGYKEVRLVTKESRHSGGDPLVLCFVDFQSPAHAATAMDAVQGYKFDEHDDETARLRIQFARHPGARSGGGHRGKR